MRVGGTSGTGILVAASGVGVGALVIGATNSSNVGPWLALGGALLVAVLTAVVTDRRQTAALEHEDGRQRAALDAERERLVLRLDHERHLSDLADLRRVLEESFRTNHVRRAVMKATRDRREQKTDEWLDRFQEARESVDALRIRLHTDDSLYQAMARLDDVLTTLAKIFTSADDEEWDAANQAWRNAYHEAVRAAQARVGSYLEHASSAQG